MKPVAKCKCSNARNFKALDFKEFKPPLPPSGGPGKLYKLKLITLIHRGVFIVICFHIDYLALVNWCTQPTRPYLHHVHCASTKAVIPTAEAKWFWIKVFVLFTSNQKYLNLSPHAFWVNGNRFYSNISFKCKEFLVTMNTVYLECIQRKSSCA